MLETMQRLESIVQTLEADWTRGLLAAVVEESDIGMFIAIHFDCKS